MLNVTVLSFSYRKGVPDDPSGNGGGFVFDCRAIPNPGRYEPYKLLDGRDASVKQFLENDGEVFKFLEHCFALADTSAARYIERGFTNLTVAFGCTGGQHRSVYCAERMADHLSRRFPADELAVNLIHRERR